MQNYVFIVAALFFRLDSQQAIKTFCQIARAGKLY
jgi:hypothetical protein